MRIDNVELIRDVILSSLRDTLWGKAIFKAKFSGTGNCTPKLWVYDTSLTEVYFDFEEVFNVAKYYISQYKEFQSDPDHRFNKVELEVFKDGTYKANYYWDEELVIEKKRKAAQNMAGWLAQRIPTMIAYQGYALYDQFHFKGDIINSEADSNEYGNYPGWRNGVFTFDFRGNNLKMDIEVEKATGRVSIPLDYEDWFINDLWEHYEITNNGIFLNEWKPWNVLEVKLEKDVRHDGGKNIEPEINYKLI